MIINREDLKTTNLKELVIDGWSQTPWMYLSQMLEYTDSVPNCVTLTFLYLMITEDFYAMLNHDDIVRASVVILQANNTIKALVDEIK